MAPDILQKKYANADYDAKIQEAKNTTDPAARMKLMHEAENIIMGQDWALNPLYFYTQKYMLSPLRAME